MSEKKLFLKIREIEHGPLTVQQVKEWIDQGKFRITDYIRSEDQTIWIMAGNLAHLRRLFDSKESTSRGAAFGSWVADMQSGNTGMMLTTSGRELEEKRLQEERQKLEEQRRALEERASALEQQVQVSGETVISEQLLAEKEKLEQERRAIEEAKQRLELEEKDIAAMGATAKRRARIPFIIGAVLIVLGLLVGGYYFLVVMPGLDKQKKEMEAKAAQIDDLIAKNEQQISDLEKTIADMKAKGQDTSLLESQLTDLQKQTEDLKAQKDGLQKGTNDAVKPEPPRDSVSGKVSLGGVTSITGAGASDPARSQGKLNGTIAGIKSGVASEYSDELRTDPSAAGSVTINFTIGANGQVKSASIASAFNGRVGSAVKRSIMGLSFPPASGDVQASYTVRFNP